MRKLILSLVSTLLVSTVAVAADSSAPPVAAESIPAGYVWLSGGSVALGIGYTWGHGTLYYSKDQKQYRFKLSGISIVDVGAAGINAGGEVYNLRAPGDIEGNYWAVTAGGTVFEGGSVAYLKNEKGVLVKLHSPPGEFLFNVPASGMRVTLQA